MATRLKRKINSYISSIYFIDILIISIITLMLFSILGDYAQVNRTQHQLAVQEIQENTQELITLIIINTIFITKIMLVIKRNPRSPKIKSNIINNVIFVLKKGFKYKETRTTLLVSIILGVITLVTYLFFLATGGYENNIFVRFFQTYPFKGSIFMIMILFLTMIYGAKKTLDISVVNEALRKVNEGNLQDDIILDGSPAIRELAHNINLIKAGYKEILEEGVRSEKLKTELISNVSHDLKTPLTSIINYVNLSLVHQGVGEYSSLYEEKNITFKVTCEEDAIYMALDGKMISRAIENLIINSLKYSLENTRVYIEIEKNEGYVTISMKNIANYEMDFSEEEMFERFARGDKSRNSKIEGSGLGLAITKSIVELHGGIIKIRREGDMFKIYVKLPLEE